MKQQHAALMTLGMMLMLACRGITAEERGRGPFEKHGGNRGGGQEVYLEVRRQVSAVL